MVVRFIVFLANLKLSGTCFYCHYVSFLWYVVFVLLGIKRLRNTNNLLDSMSKLGGCMLAKKARGLQI